MSKDYSFLPKNTIWNEAIAAEAAANIAPTQNPENRRNIFKDSCCYYPKSSDICRPNTETHTPKDILSWQKFVTLPAKDLE